MQPVRLFDGNDVPMDVVDGVAAPAGHSTLLIGGKDAAGLARTLRTSDDGSLSQRISGRVSAANSSIAPLAAGETFLGVFEDILDVGQIHVLVRADQPSDAAGLTVEYSLDGVDVDDSDVFAIPANTGKVYAFPPHARFFRIRYKNGATLQGVFRLQTVYKGARTKPSTHALDAVLGDNDDAELVRSVVSGRKANGNYEKIQIGTDNRFLVDARPTALLHTVFDNPLLNAGSEDMSINGSGSPVVFQFQPDAVNDFEVEDIQILAEEVGLAFGDCFLSSAVSTLANGLLFEIKANDVTATLDNLLRTRDLIDFASGIDGVFLATAGTKDLVRVVRLLPSGGTILKKAGTFATPDFVRVTVRDNLNAIDFLRVRILGVKR